MFQPNHNQFEPKFASEAAADLWGAAQLLRKHGHCKHYTRNPEGQMCLGGALSYHLTRDYNAWDGERFNNAFLLLEETVFGNHDAKRAVMHRLIKWNNADERKASEVIDALERAATTKSSLASRSSKEPV